MARLDGVIEIPSSDSATSQQRTPFDRYPNTPAMHNDRQYHDRGYSTSPSRLQESFSDSDVSFQEDQERSESYEESATTPSTTSDVVMPPPPQLHSYTATETTDRIDRVIEIPRSSEDMSVTSETISEARSDVTPVNPLPTVRLQISLSYHWNAYLMSGQREPHKL